MNSDRQTSRGDVGFSSITRCRIFRCPPGVNGLGRCLSGVVGSFLFILTLRAPGQVVDVPTGAAPVLTNIAEIWTVPRAQADEEYRIKTEVVIYFNDTEWGNASGECLGTPRWLPIFDSPFPLRAGERVAIDGVIVPQRERFVWDKTRIRILEDKVPLKAETVSDLSKNPQELKDHLVSVEGLIDSELDESSHCTINFLSGSTSARAYVLKGTNSAPVHFKQGDFVRMKCVYSPQFDRNGNLSDLSLWIGTPADIEVIGSLNTDERFATPATLSKDIQSDSYTNNVIHVVGVVRNYEPGKWVTIWDDTGQIMVQSRQTQPLRFGDRVDAIGYPFVLGVQQCLHDGLYRLITPTNVTVSASTISTNALPLHLAEQVRDLSLEEASHHLPVSFRGIVTWSHRGSSFAYVQDASSGIRVVNPQWDEHGTAKPGTIVLLEGVTGEGNFVPVITNAVLHRAGWWNMEEGQA